MDKGYEVHGNVRRVAFEDEFHRFYRIRHIKDRIILHAASLENYASIFHVVEKEIIGNRITYLHAMASCLITSRHAGVLSLLPERYQVRLRELN